MTTTTTPRTFEEAMSTLASRIDGFEVRQQQADLARMIEGEFFAGVLNEMEREKAIQEDTWEPVSMFGQASTGTGKSLAYLIPAIVSGKRIVVSVTTKALQSQLEQTDLPFLTEHLMPFTWAILKGRTSYLCLGRDVPDGEIPVLPQITKWVKEHPEFSGLREDLPFDLDHREWAMICSQSEECAANKCSKAENLPNCYAARARAAARKAQVVVVNHSLFFTDLAVRVNTEGAANLLGEFDALIADEAHELAEIATSALAKEFSQRSFGSLGMAVASWGRNYGSPGTSNLADAAASALVRASDDFFAALPRMDRQQTLRLRVNNLEALGEAGGDILSALERCLSSVRQVTSIPEEKEGQKMSLMSRIVNLHAIVMALLTDDLDDTVRWIEKIPARGSNPPSVKVSMAPVDVSGYLSEHLFDRWPVLMISATLAVKGKFDFQANQLGVKRYVSKIVGSPFDFQNNSRLYVPAAFPETNSNAWESVVADEIRALVNAAGGRTLILFTSIAHMRRAADILRDVLPYPVRMQGEGSVADLRAWFMASDETVLLGTKSFMTGFDVRGSALTNVIITKMTFPVPDDPLTEARMDRIVAKGGNSFGGYMLPVMSLVLQQAAGRLMRHSTDRGLVAILDARLVTKGYGRQVLRDLPPMPLVKTRREAEQFLAETAHHFER